MGNSPKSKMIWFGQNQIDSLRQIDFPITIVQMPDKKVTTQVWAELKNVRENRNWENENRIRNWIETASTFMFHIYILP